MKNFLLPIFLTAALGGILSAKTPNPWTADVSTEGILRLSQDGRELVTIRPGLFDANWEFAVLEQGKAGAAAAKNEGVIRGRINGPRGAEVNTELSASIEGAGARLRYRLVPKRDMELNSLNVTMILPVPVWAGCVADGQDVPLPKVFEKGRMALWSAPTKSLRLTTADGTALQLDFTEPAQVLVQDDRQWDETFSVRIESPKAPRKWTTGQALELDFALTSPEGLTLEKDGPVTIQAGKEWLPLEAALDVEPGSALDFSQLVPRHAPAGQFGRVIAMPEGRFAFAQQAEKPARFYGVNFCFSAQYLEHEQADAVAARLARIGYNAVRLHHYEGELIDRGAGAAVRFQPDKLDQLDYLFAAFKRNGLYVTTDLFVSRPVPAAAIYEGESGDFGMDEFKSAVLINERAFANYKAFARALLDHVNPHTGLRYADDPALSWLNLVNEGNPGNFMGRIKGKLRDDWQRAWNRWLVERYPDPVAREKALGKLPAGQDPAQGTVPLQNVYAKSPATTVFSVFLAEVERDFFRRMRQFLRDELHCGALLTDCNAWTNPVQFQAVRTEFDYVDDHFYVDHPHFIDRPWSLPSRCANTSPIAGGARGGRACAFTRLFGKPFTITEYNYAGPGRFRGVGGILTGALGAIQDWDGLWRFAYSHQREGIAQPAQMGYFDIAGDPLNQAAERASLCLFLRGDIAPAEHAAAIGVTPEELLDAPGTSRDKTPSWEGLAWLTRVGWSVGAEPKAEKDGLLLPFEGGVAMDGEAEKKILGEFRERGWLPADNRTDPAKDIFQSENGEVTIDSPENVFTLDTPRTAGGFAPAGKKIETGAATIEIVDTDATVWVSSLEGEPIATSKRLLITHLTDLQNTGTRYGDRKRQILLAWGRLPHLVRAGSATVRLRLANPGKAKVFSLAVSGKRIGEIAARAGDNSLEIPLGVDAGGQARMLYEVEIGE